MEYICKMKEGNRLTCWTGEIQILSCRSGQCEAEINGRGTYFHIIAGRHKYGNYLCVPNHDVGCELSRFGDLFWNTERLSEHMRKVDAITLATGIAEIPKITGQRDTI